MRRSLLGRVPFVALFLCTLAAAQRTWIVDAGGGGDFRDIPSALDAANHGDTVLVRPGWYRVSTTTAKGVTLLGGRDDSRPDLHGRLTITSLPAGRTFVMRGFRHTPGLFEPFFHVDVSGCEGKVLFEDVQIDGVTKLLGTPERWPGLRITGTAFVSFSNGSILASPGVDVSDSTVVLTNTTVRGAAARFIGGLDCLPYAATPAILGTRSKVVVSGGAMAGGDGIHTTAWFCGSLPPAEGTRLSTCETLLTGDWSTVVAGGIRMSSQGAEGPSWAIDASGGAMTYNPNIQLVGGLRTNQTRVTLAATPVLSASATAPGTEVNVEILGRSGAFASVFGSLAALPQSTAFGDLWLDLRSAVLLHSGTVPRTGQIGLRIPLCSCFPRGLPLLFQSASLDNTLLALSNPAVTILH